MIKKLLYILTTVVILVLLIAGTIITTMLPMSEVRSSDLIVPLLILLGFANALRD